MIRYLFTSLLLLTMAACQTNKSGKILVVPQDKELDLSSCFDSYDVISFSGIELGEIRDFKDIGDYYVVRASNIRSDIHLFDKTGKFINSIIPRGAGSGKAINVSDFAFNKSNNTIDLLINYGQKVATYSIDKKEIIDTWELPTNILVATTLARLDDNRLIFYKKKTFTANDIYKINIFNTKTKATEAQYLKIDRNISKYLDFDQRNNIYKKGSSVIFYEAFLDKAYQITPDSISTYFEYEKRTLGIPQKELKFHLALEEFIGMCVSKSLIYAHIDCFEYNNKIFSKYTIKEQEYINIANLKNRKSKSYASLYDDMIMDQKVNMTTYKLVASDDNGMYFALKHKDLKRLYPDYKDNKKFNNVTTNNELIIQFK